MHLLPFTDPENDYEKKRLQNIAEAQKLFKDNLKASAKALKGNKSKPSRLLIKCDYCKKVFKLQHSLEKHKRLWHKETINTGKIKSEFYFECIDSTCFEKFKTYNMIKEHIGFNHTFACTSCNETFNYKEYNSRPGQREKIHKCRPFKCECGAKFKNEEDLIAHDCHRCKYCNKPYPSKAALTKHTRAHRNVNTGSYESKLLRPEYDFNMKLNEICAICDAQFAGKKELNDHANEIHRKTTNQTKPSRNAAISVKLAN